MATCFTITISTYAICYSGQLFDAEYSSKGFLFFLGVEGGSSHGLKCIIWSYNPGFWIRLTRCQLTRAGDPLWALSGFSETRSLSNWDCGGGDGKENMLEISHPPPCPAWLYCFGADYSWEVRGMKLLGALKGLLVSTGSASWTLCHEEKLETAG